MNKFIKITSAAAMLVFASNASAILIDFEGEAGGTKANGYTTAGAPGVHFTDTAGADLNAANYGTQGDGMALAVYNDGDGGGLRINLDFFADYIAIDFGNDDPYWTNPGDIAYLEAYNGGGLVGTNQVAMNRDDIMNQTIDFGGVLFDEIFFLYTDPDLGGFTNVGGTPLGLIEVVDNIVINEAVPEPGPLALLAIGLLGLVISRRKRA